MVLHRPFDPTPVIGKVAHSTRHVLRAMLGTKRGREISENSVSCRQLRPQHSASELLARLYRSFRGDGCPARSCSSSGSRSPLLSLLPKLFAFTAFVASMPSACWAQDKVEIYGGYSYFRASVREGQFNPCVTVCPNSTFFTSHANLNGWELSGQALALPRSSGQFQWNLRLGGCRWHP